MALSAPFQTAECDPMLHLVSRLNLGNLATVAMLLLLAGGAIG